jgi:hypothetical protein
MAPAAKPSSHNKVLILASGGVAAAAVAAMAWKTLAGSAAAPILPPAERVQKLAHAEQLFASKFPNVRSYPRSLKLLILAVVPECIAAAVSSTTQNLASTETA